MTAYTPRDFDPYSGFGDEIDVPLTRREMNLIAFLVVTSWLTLIGLLTVLNAIWRVLT